MASAWPALRAGLVSHVSRHAQHLHFQKMRERQSELARFPDINALIEYQHRGDRTHDPPDATLRALVAEAQDGGDCAGTAINVLFLVLWPGLDAVHRRLLRYCRSDVDSLAADIGGATSIGIARLDLRRVTWIAATLVQNVERDLRRQLMRNMRHADHDEIDGDVPDAAAAAPEADRLLERDLERLIGEDAAIVVAVALNGESQAEVAARIGITHDALRKRYRRALARLRTALEDFF